MLLEKIAGRTGWTICWFIILFVFTYLIHLEQMLPNLMEARNFVTAREMVEFGNWLLPTMNGEPRFAKPPLPTWETATLISLTGNSSNLFLLRLPSVIAGIILVLSTYLFIVINEGSRSLALICSTVLATSVMTIQMAKIGSWDIHCHAWLMAGLATWVYLIKRSKSPTLYLMLTAICFALSFYSKGPISFYTLLLPFILASFFTGSKKWKQVPMYYYALIIALVILISAAWPLYIYMNHAEVGQEVVKAETTAWMNRHVKPFYFYLNFPLFMGIWIPFTIAVFVWKYASKRIPNYRFYLFWTLASLIFLSVIPEKKDRYLLPMIIPLSILVGGLVHHYTSKSQAEKNAAIVTIHRVLIIALCIASIALAYWYGFNNELLSLVMFICIAVLFLGILFAILKWRKQFSVQFILSVVIILSVTSFMTPLAKQFLYPNKNYRSMSAIRDNPLTSELEKYSIGEINLMYVFDIGERVNPIQLEDTLTLPAKYPACVVSLSPLDEMFQVYSIKHLQVKEIDVIDPGIRKTEWLYHVSIVNKK